MRRALLTAAGALLLAGCASSGTGGTRRPSPSAPVVSTSAVSAIPPSAADASPAGASAPAGPSAPAGLSATLGRPARPDTPAPAAHRGGHVVVVIEENHSAAEIIGNPAARYFSALARRGATLTEMHAVAHPSEPNYLALFSGSTHGVTSDACPLTLGGATIGGELLSAGLSFTGYAEGLPNAGSATCSAGAYARKHVPWTDFTLPAAVDQPLTAWPTDFATLPSLSFVIPDLDHDMHDGTVSQADTWLRVHLNSYARWAVGHGSLLVVTWDEDDHSANNRIPTFVVGAGVRPQLVTTRVTTYSLLRLLADRFGVSRPGAAATAAPIIVR